MARTLTTTFKRSTSRVDNYEYPVFLVEINHDTFFDTIRLCDYIEDIESNGNTFTAIGMKVMLPSDTDNSSSLGATLTIDNVGRTLVNALEDSNGLPGAKVTLSQIILSEPDDIVMPITFNLVNITMDMTSVTGTLTKDDIANSKSVNLLYTPSSTPGLFK